jgi:hypothetical protein
MAKSKARYLAEILGSDGKVQKSKSKGFTELAVSDLPDNITNAKLQNSSITVAGDLVSLGGSVAIDTSEITEHTNAKFHTTARARSAISATGSLSYNSSTGVMSFTMPAQNTSNITEGSNLYFTNARADARITAADTGDLSEGSNLYHTTARARAAISENSTQLAYNSSTGVLTFTQGDTDTVSEGSNLYYTNARADARANARIAASDTGDLSEGSNLYYTNARADARIAAADTGDLSEGSNLYYTNARADARITNAGSGNWNTAYGWGNHASGGYAPLAGPALTGAPTAPTAAANTNTTQIATTAYVQTELTDLIDGAPGTLDSLNELAAAINDDANYNSTLTTALGTKVAKTSNQALGTAANVMTISGNTITLARGDSTTDTVTVPDTNTTYTAGTNMSLSGTEFSSTNTTYSVGDGGLTQKNFTTTLKSKLDGIAAGATNTAAPHYTSAIAVGDGGLTQKNFTTALNTKLTGIAASANNYTLPFTDNSANWNTAYGWGNHASAGYVTTDNNTTYTAGTNMSLSGTEFSSTNTTYSVGDGGLTTKNFTAALKTKLDGIETSATADQTAVQILTAIKTVDGASSGLDADLLDGIHGASLLRSDVHDTGVGLAINGGTLNQAHDSTLYVTAGNNSDWGITIGAASGKTEYGMQIQMPSSFNYALRILKNGSEHFNVNSTGATIGGNYIWHAGNDGASSGLDADLLDGQHGSYYAAASSLSSYLPLSGGTLSSSLHLGNDVGLTSTTTGETLRVLFPGGGARKNSGSSETGAIKITLPVGMTNSMLSVKVSVYQYDSHESFEVHFGGYNYPTGNTWAHNPFGYITGSPKANHGPYAIRFGYDSNSKACVYIGETNTTWSYPTISVTEAEIGYSGYTNTSWDNGWDVSIVTSFENVTATIAATETNIGISLANGVTHQQTAQLKLKAHTNGWAGGLALISSDGSDTFQIHPDDNGYMYVDKTWNFSAVPHVGVGNPVWYTGNDGSGSGLDADLLDGNHASAFLIASPTSITIDGTQDQTISTTTHSLEIKNAGATSSGGLVLQGSDGTHGLQLYWDGSGANYGFLDGAWASWDIQKVRNGTFKVDEGAGLKRVLNEANWSSYISNNNQLTNGAGYITASGTANQSHMVSGSAFGTTSSPSSVLEYQQASGQTDTRLAPSGDWHNSIRMGHGNPYNYYSNTIAARMTGTGYGDLYTQCIYNNSAQGWRKIWSAGNDGSGSGLDADLLDGVNSASFLRSDTADTFTGTLTMGTQFALVPNNYGLGLFGLYASTRYQHVWSMGTAYKTSTDGTSYGNIYGLTYTHPNIGTGTNQSISGLSHQLQGRENGTLTWALGTGIWTANTITSGNQGTLWGSSNDGSGSGLDADLLDGQQGSYYSAAHSHPYLGTSAKAADSDLFDGHNSDKFVFGTSGYGTTSMGFASITNQKSGFYDVHNSGTPTSTWYSLLNMAHYGTNHGHQIAGSFYSAGDIYNRNNNNTSLSSWAKIWNTANDGSGSGLDADLLDGVQGSGYARLGGSNHARTYPNRWFATADSDNIIDFYDQNHAKAHLGNSSKYTTSRPVITSDQNYWVGSMGWGNVDLNTILNYGSGFWDSWSSPSNRPSTYTSHWNGFNAMHYTASSTYHHGMQMAMGAGNPAHTYLRGWWSSSSGYAWQKIWTDGNDGSGSGLDADLLDGNQASAFMLAGAAPNAHNHTGVYLPIGSKAADSDLLDGLNSASSGADIVLRTDSNSYLQINNWTQVGGAGMYSSSVNGFHWYANNSFTYGCGRLNGARNGYSGIVLDTGGDVVLGMYDSGGNGGDYNTSSGWHSYYHRGNDCLGIAESTTSSSYGCYVTGAIYATGDVVGSSDVRLKKNINTIENGLAKVEKLRGVTYEWKDAKESGSDGNNITPERMGVIAQEIIDIVPEVVTHDKENDRYGVSYGHLTGVLIEAIKELSDKVKELEKKLEEK